MPGMPVDPFGDEEEFHAALFSHFQGGVRAGFTEEQAMELTARFQDTLFRFSAETVVAMSEEDIAKQLGIKREGE
jgi:hypothetical protein